MFSKLSTVFSSAKGARKLSAQRAVSGNISSLFDQKTDGNSYARFSELKKAVWKDSMSESWAQVLDALKEKTELIEALGSKAGLDQT